MFDINDEDDQIPQIRAQNTGDEVGNALSGFGALLGNMAGQIQKIQNVQAQSAFKEDYADALKDISSPDMSTNQALLRLAKVAEDHPKVSGKLMGELTSMTLSLKEQAAKDARAASVTKAIGDAIAQGKTPEETIGIFSKSKIRGMSPEDSTRIGNEARANIQQRQESARIASESSAQRGQITRAQLALETFRVPLDQLNPSQQNILERLVKERGADFQTQQEVLEKLRQGKQEVQFGVQQLQPTIERAGQDPNIARGLVPITTASEFNNAMEDELFKGASDPKARASAAKRLDTFLSQFDQKANPKGEIMPGTEKEFEVAQKVLNNMLSEEPENAGIKRKAIMQMIAGQTLPNSPLREKAIQLVGQPQAPQAFQALPSAEEGLQQLRPEAGLRESLGLRPFSPQEAQTLRTGGPFAIEQVQKQRELQIPSRQRAKLEKLQAVQQTPTVARGPKEELIQTGTIGEIGSTFLNDAASNMGVKSSQVFKAINTAAKGKVVNFNEIKSIDDAEQVISELKARGLLK